MTGRLSRSLKLCPKCHEKYMARNNHAKKCWDCFLKEKRWGKYSKLRCEENLKSISRLKVKKNEN